ncbi:tRNA lysidine(34) synthetase TilS [Aurantiacibacter luteus]|uniref:tRNA(Ile)-lysidine synthase n=1 Tax=Aurantiacibacter luteus TaxID=1581420 RepID=A0A0G9MP52_9SPHN|nr:tRNA lysidine(34) synthetase TilS [Aurantiacibacter luteus]KLE32369.1 hypothetical protein AAW00_13035 [Aurantiacibacter luteus]
MAGSTAIDPALVERFHTALGRLNPGGGRIGLAVSGGPDSMAMLLLAHEAIPGHFEVATVDHGLRPEAGGECALVAKTCETRGVTCEVLAIEVPEGNVQAMARLARYEALSAWAERRRLAAVATAHHVDDQAETLVMRLNRGSGVRGLAGVRASNYPFEARFEAPVIRPLLGFRRAELRSVVKSARVAFATDPGNSDDRFERVTVRRELAAADWLDPRALARSAAHLAEAERALEYLTDRVYPEFVEHFASHAAIQPPPDRELARRLVERVIASLNGSARGSDVARLVDGLARGEDGNVGGVLARNENGVWVLRPEPARRRN